jgi:short-subunit dehydrogenase
MQLNGAVVVVTGASSGIGEAAARALARRRATVVLAARRMQRLERLAGEIAGEGGASLPQRCDVGIAADVRSLARIVEETFGRCDALVNNAGVPGGGPFLDVSVEQIERVIRVNVLGAMFATKAFVPMMAAAGRGHVVNVASLAGRFAVPGASVYAASKHAVVAFSESLHHELANRGVRVTALNPGFVDTEGFPQVARPKALSLSREEVAEEIVRILRDEIAPERSMPRWAASLQAARVLTPPLYRWGMGRLARSYSE